MTRNVKYAIITKCINGWTKIRLKTMATISILMTLVILSMACTTFFYDTCHMYMCIEETMKKRYKERRIKQKNFLLVYLYFFIVIKYYLSAIILKNNYFPSYLHIIFHRLFKSNIKYIQI